MSDSFDDGITLGGDFAVDSRAAISGDSGKVVTARGTEDGLVLRIDGRASWEEIITDLEQFLGGRKKFFEGGEVAIEWLERLPTKEQSKELENLLRQNYGMEIVGRKKKPTRVSLAKDNTVSKQQKKGSGVTIPLFEDLDQQGVSMDASSLVSQIETICEGPLLAGEGRTDTERAAGAAHKRYLTNMAKILGEEVFYEDDANAKIVFGTLRSGQRYETPFSLIVIGDVNPGADLVAGGDIIVLGSLRGTAHASAYDDDSFDHVIFALQMQPMQLRIGSVISRGSDEVVKGAEIARIENRRIIVEPYNPRAFLSKKQRQA